MGNWLTSFKKEVWFRIGFENFWLQKIMCIMYDLKYDMIKILASLFDTLMHLSQPNLFYGK